MFDIVYNSGVYKFIEQVLYVFICFIPHLLVGWDIQPNLSVISHRAKPRVRTLAGDETRKITEYVRKTDYSVFLFVLTKMKVVILS